jgi:hypothetical protein
MTIEEKLDLQRAEFNAAFVLSDVVRSLASVPVVDGGYPKARMRYETALQSFLAAVKANRES